MKSFWHNFFCTSSRMACNNSCVIRTNIDSISSKKGKVMNMRYSKTEVQEFKNGVNVIHFPDLTEEERENRKEQLKKATARFMAAVERERRKI